jgi:hypothetical protein
MRYNLRIVLAAMAFIALAAAAIGTDSYLLADMTVGATVLMWCYALVVALAAGPGRRRGVAWGFVILFAVHAAGVYLVPNRVLSGRAVELVGYDVSSNGMLIVEDRPAFANNPRFVGLSPMNFRSTVHANWLRPVHALATVAAGLVGCAMGYWAFRTAARSNGDEA